MARPAGISALRRGALAGGKRNRNAEPVTLPFVLDGEHFDAAVDVGQVKPAPSGEKINPVKLSCPFLSGLRMWMETGSAESVASSDGNVARCRMPPVVGEITTNSAVFPAVTRI